MSTVPKPVSREYLRSRGITPHARNTPVESDVERLEQGYLHWAPLRDVGHDCQPPMLERRIYAPVGPSPISKAWECSCDYGTGVIDSRCPYHGEAAQLTAMRPRPYHTEYLPKGEPGTVWRCACGQPWVVKVRHHDRGIDVVAVRTWEQTTERAVTRALRRAAGRRWRRRGRVTR